MKCYECKWLDRSVMLTSCPPSYNCTLGLGSHHADHECEYEFVPVVRCKDCKWYIDNTTVEESLNNCRWRTDENPDDDDFCSLGERREE